MKIRKTANILGLAVAVGTLSLLVTAPYPAYATEASAVQLAQEATPESMGPTAGEATSEDEKQAAKEAFERFQATLDIVNENISKIYGGPPFVKVEEAGVRTVKITPSKEWMAVPERHNRNAMMLYRMWKNANQFRPVTLVILDDTGNDYITLKDTPTGLVYRARQN